MRHGEFSHSMHVLFKEESLRKENHKSLTIFAIHGTSQALDGRDLWLVLQ